MSDDEINVVQFKRPGQPRFAIKWDGEIKRAPGADYMIKGLTPTQGLGVLFGQSQAFKSFIALDMAYHVALGKRWADRRVSQGVALYICAEGMTGMTKRVEGFRKAHGQWPENVPFALMPASPNLGSPKGDLGLLVASIESMGRGRTPQFIILDTLSQMLHGAEENGAGMTAFIQNAQTLSNHFEAFVLAIHHTPHSSSDRMRGHSSLLPAIDANIFAERLPDGYSTALTFKKNKDEQNDVKMTANLRRLVLGNDEDGDEVSTLVVESIEDGLAPRADRKAKQAKLPHQAQTALASLKALLSTGDIPAPCNDIPAGQKVVSLDKWREHAVSSGISASDDKDAVDKAFKRAYERLMSDGKVRLWNKLAWIA